MLHCEGVPRGAFGRHTFQSTGNKLEQGAEEGEVWGTLLDLIRIPGDGRKVD